MSKTITVSYPTKLLRQEKPLIRESVKTAINGLFENRYLKSLSVLPSDPLLLLQWRLKQAPWLYKRRGRLSKKSLRSVASIIPPETAESMIEGGAAAEDYLKTLTLRRVVEELSQAAENDAQLEEWLRRLIAPFRDKNTKFEETGREKRFLILNWIARDDHPKFFEASLCFYSNRALAQALHFERWHKPLPPTRLGTAEKTAAKHVERLGLRPATKHIFREMPIDERGHFYWEPFEERLA